MEEKGARLVRLVHEHTLISFAEEVVRLVGTPAALLLSLQGPLGAGKTTFVRALVQVLGGDPAEVASPTFVLERRYALHNAPWHTLAHWDWFRIGGPEELVPLHFDTRSSTPGVLTVVEWPERAENVLQHLKITWWHIVFHPRTSTEREVVVQRVLS